jgi:hypothetical protein
MRTSRRRCSSAATWRSARGGKSHFNLTPALARIAESAGLDQAAAFALLGRSWQLFAAPVTLFVIVRYLTPETQGYYYTFASLLALQSFVELGLSNVVISVASHEWSRLGLDAEGRIRGSDDALSRLVSFGRRLFRWYAAASMLFVAAVGAAGYWFFADRDLHGVGWQAPWFVLVALTGAQLWISSFISVLEGCNQVVTVQRVRVVQAVAASAAFWVVAAAGGELWAAVAMTAARLLPDLFLVAVQYRPFFAPFGRPAAGAIMSWRDEVWPMQWRIGMAGLVNYFAYFLFTPVMFRYHGAVAAGQIGMTMQITGSIQSLAMAFVSTKVPQFGVLVARRDYDQLHPLWRRSLVASTIVVAIGGGGLVAAVALAGAFDLTIAARLLRPADAALLAAAALLVQISQCQTAYMRAHRRELLVVLAVTSSLLTGALVWLLGRLWGPTGALAGNLAVASLIVIWETAIWRRFRAEVTGAASYA